MCMGIKMFAKGKKRKFDFLGMRYSLCMEDIMFLKKFKTKKEICLHIFPD